jgi:uncharacterized protein YecT (DUF1311 family)
MMRKICLTALLLSMTAGAYAAGCATPKNAFDQVYCAGTLFAQVDHDLNVEYGSLRKNLKPIGLAALKQGQLAWIKDRNDQCSEEKPSGYFVNLDCANTMTQERLAFLKERDRECTSTGCVESKMGGR